MSESFPIIDPLSAGHTLADKKMAEMAKNELEAKIDRDAALEEEALRLAAEAKKKELDEIYEKEDGEGVMDDIDPSRRRN